METSSLTKNISDPSGRFLLRLAGAVLSWAGIGLLALMLWSIEAAVFGDARFGLGAGIFCATLLIVGTFCVATGFRMFLNRPNRYGSILSPRGWSILGIVFGLVGIFTVVTAFDGVFEALGPSAAVGVVAPWALAYASFRMAKRTKTAEARAL
jgi:hypothetical protein